MKYILEQLNEEKANKETDYYDDEATQAFDDDDESTNTSMIVLKARAILVSLSPSSSTSSLEVSESSEFFTFFTTVKLSILLEALTTMSRVLILLAIITEEIDITFIELTASTLTLTSVQ
jgi:hypothetical protein